MVSVTQMITHQNQRLVTRKQRSKKSGKVISSVQDAVVTFVQIGKSIGRENPEYMTEINQYVDDVSQAGQTLAIKSEIFSTSPLDVARRNVMMEAARSLLSSVTRMLLFADYIDVQKLIKSIAKVEKMSRNFRTATSKQELLNLLSKFQSMTKTIVQQSRSRQDDILDPRKKTQLANAVNGLEQSITLLLSTCRTHINHSDVPAASVNREYIVNQLAQSLQYLRMILEGYDVDNERDINGVGDLMAALDSLDEMVVVDPGDYDDRVMRLAWEEFLESIVSGAALMADSDNTRLERRQKIVMDCNNVRQALQELIETYLTGVRGAELNSSLENMLRRTKDLRRQLRKAVVDHVSDNFVQNLSPLDLLIEAAKVGDHTNTDLYIEVFTEHAHKLVEVANLAISMSDDEDGVRLVRQASAQVDSLYKQVINAAKILSLRPESQAAQDNMELFRQTWAEAVILLTEAVDQIVTIDDFLAVSENHVLDDVKKCCLAMKQKDVETLDQITTSIEGRIQRINDVVLAEMEKFEPGLYTENVLEAVKVMQMVHVPHFVGQVDTAIQCLLNVPMEEIDENEFLDSSRLLYDGIRDIRRAVLMGIIYDDIQSDTTEDDDTSEDSSDVSYFEVLQDDVEDYPNLHGYGIDSAVDAMKQLPDDEKSQIAEKVEEFITEQQKFDQEVSKWMEEGNELIQLAIKMSHIMANMTDFTRGEGPLKTNTDIIQAAQKISEIGTQLDKLARQIAERCPESSTKKDLLAYLQRIALYCHQLDICSKVKAEVTIVSGELVISALDSATSLIQAAKNLMTSVLLTIKACYVASTKYKNHQEPPSPLVVWKIKSPERKPLDKTEFSINKLPAVRKSSGNFNTMTINKGNYFYRNKPLFRGLYTES